MNESVKNMNKRMDPTMNNDFETLQDCVKDMKQSAEAIGMVLMQIKDNDVAFNERLTTLESKHKKDISDLSEKLASFYQDLDVLKTTMKQIGESQNSIQSSLISTNFFKTRSKEDQSFRKISNSDEEIPNVNSNNGISGEDDSGVNLGAPLCSSTNSDQDSNQRPCSQNSVVKTCGDDEFVKERINKFVEAASNLCKNAAQGAITQDDLSCYNKPWSSGNGKVMVLFRGALEKRTISNDSNEHYRYELCLELLQSERTLCNAISTVQIYYCDPLKYSNVMSSRDINLMFPNELFRLYEQHCIILHKVQECINDHFESSDNIFDIYVKFFEPRGYLFCLYSDYLSSFPQLMKFLTENLSENSECLKFLIRHQTSLEFHQRQIKLISASSLQMYLTAPLTLIKQYERTFQRFLKAEMLSESAVEKVEHILETLKELMNEDCQTQSSPILQRLTSTPPLKPRRSKQFKKPSPLLQHSSSDATTSPFEKKPLFERHNCTSVSRKQRKLRLAYSGSEVYLHRADSIEIPQTVGSSSFFTQIDAISEPSIYQDMKQSYHNDTNFDPANQQNSIGNGLLLSQSHQVLSTARSVQVGPKFTKRHSLVKQVGGIKNSVAAFFSKRKNERRFSEIETSSSKCSYPNVSQESDKKLKKAATTKNNNPPSQRIVKSQPL